MDWRLLEWWAIITTIAAYVAAVVSFVVFRGMTYVLILRSIDQYDENHERRARERAEWEALPLGQKAMPRAAPNFLIN